MCGENLPCEPEFLFDEGSPPRVRGKHLGVQDAAALGGITPACAGKTLCYTRKEPSAGDHPRVCGENHIAAHPLKIIVGSPPRVRGKLH